MNILEYLDEAVKLIEKEDKDRTGNRYLGLDKRSMVLLHELPINGDFLLICMITKYDITHGLRGSVWDLIVSKIVELKKKGMLK